MSEQRMHIRSEYNSERSSNNCNVDKKDHKTSNLLGEIKEMNKQTNKQTNKPANKLTSKQACEYAMATSRGY